MLITVLIAAHSGLAFAVTLLSKKKDAKSIQLCKILKAADAGLNEYIANLG